MSGTLQFFHLRPDKVFCTVPGKWPSKQAQSLCDHFLCQLHASHSTADLHRKWETSRCGLDAQETAGVCQCPEMPELSYPLHLGKASSSITQEIPPDLPFTSPLRLKKVASSKRDITFALSFRDFLRTSASFSFLRAFVQACGEQVRLVQSPWLPLSSPIAAGICLKRVFSFPW